jgi:hypothetical protein
MSEQDVLRLAAEVVDKYSGPIKQMQRALRDLTDYTRKSNQEGQRGTKTHREELGKLQETFRRLDQRVKASVTPTLAAFGVTALSVAGAVEALRSALFGFGDSARQLTYLSRETGFTINQLRALDALARRVNVSPEQMNKSLEQFTKHLHDVRLRIPGEMTQWRDTLNQNIYALAENISRMPAAKAWRAAINELQFIPDPQERRSFLKLWGLPENFADMTADELNKAWLHIKARLKPLSADDIKKGLAYEDALDDLRDTIGDVEDSVGGQLAPAITKITKAIDDFVAKNKGELIVTLNDIATSIQKADWGKFAGDVEHAAGAAGDLAKHLGDVKSVLETIGSMWAGKILFGAPGAAAGAETSLLRGNDPLGVGHNLWDEPVPKALKKAYDWLREGRGTKAPALMSPSDAAAAAAGEGMPGAPLFHKQSFEGSTPFQSGGGFRVIKAGFSPDQTSPRFMDAAFRTGGGAGGTRDAEAAIARGTKAGMIAALREWWQAYSESDDLGLGGGAGSARAGAAGVRAALGGSRVAGLGSGGAGGGEIGGGLGGGAGSAAARPGGRSAGPEVGGPGGSVAPGRGGHVNPADAYNHYRDLFKNSPLNGFVPKDGAKWGITKGTPDEWARLATATTQQESGFNALAGNGGLNQFRSRDLRNWGVNGAVNDPNAQMRALTNQWSKDIVASGNVSEPGRGPGSYSGWQGAGAYFGSMRGRVPDIAKYLGRGGFADRVAAAAAGQQGAPGSAPIDALPSKDGPPAAFIMHHTGPGIHSFAQLKKVLQSRHLGVEYAMDENGNIRQIGQPGAANIKDERGPAGTALGRRLGLHNSNIVGMEVMAADDKHVKNVQVAAAMKFIHDHYPSTPVYGHGEVQRDKEPDEGKTIVDAIRNQRAEGHFANMLAGHRALMAARKPHWQAGDIMKALQGGGDDTELLRAGRKSGMLAPAAGKPAHGQASLDVRFHNLPRGTRTAMNTSGPLWKDVSLNRGRAMVPATQDA